MKHYADVLQIVFYLWRSFALDFILFSFANFCFEALGEWSHQAFHGNHIGIDIRCASPAKVEISFRPATANM